MRGLLTYMGFKNGAAVVVVGDATGPTMTPPFLSSWFSFDCVFRSLSEVVGPAEQVEKNFIAILRT